MLNRLLAGALIASLSALPAAPALAHEGNPNFRSEINGLTPTVEGIDVEVLNFDDSLRLENRSGSDVVVEGYEGEPYVRIAADGTVEVNERSPSSYLNEDRFGEVEVPEAAAADAQPRWRTIDRTGQYAWHDHRSHYMAEGTPPQVSDEGERTEVFDYRIPLRVDGERVVVEGTLTWVGQGGGAPLAPFVALGAVALLATAAVILRRRRSRRAAEGEAW